MRVVVAALRETCSKICRAISPRQRRSLAPRGRLLLEGLDGAGKTSVLTRFTHGVATRDAGMLGDMHTLTFGAHVFMCIEASRVRFRGYLTHLPWLRVRVDALIFVVDAHDYARLEEALERLRHIIALHRERGMDHTPVLVFANKQDLTKAIPVEQLATHLDVDGVRSSGRACFLQECSATADPDDGVLSGFKWLEAELSPLMKHTT